jgi:hypothetical protein
MDSFARHFTFNCVGDKVENFIGILDVAKFFGAFNR